MGEFLIHEEFAINNCNSYEDETILNILPARNGLPSQLALTRTRIEIDRFGNRRMRWTKDVPIEVDDLESIAHRMLAIKRTLEGTAIEVEATLRLKDNKRITKGREKRKGRSYAHQIFRRCILCRKTRYRW